MTSIGFRKEQLDDIVILDGGLATELTKDGFEFDNDPLWSARLLFTAPEAIKNAHRRYLDAGSDVIITSSYQTSLETLMQYGNCTKQVAEDHIKLTVSLAKDACKEFWKTVARGQRTYPLVAGSVGPYGACQSDASEYHGDYVDSMSLEDLVEWHRPRLQILVDSGVDLLAVETFPALKEAQAVATLLKEFEDTKAWVTFSCKDETKLCHGEQFSDAVSALAHFDQVIGVGVNCTHPEFVAPLLNSIKDIAPEKFRIVYPNSGEAYANGGWLEHTKCKRIPELASSWVNAGASWIGGCCRTSPEDILELRHLLKRPH